MVQINVRTESHTALHTVLSLVANDHCNVAEVMEDGLIVEATGEWKEINALVQKLVPFGIRHIVRTGTVALCKNPGEQITSLVGTVNRSGDPVNR